MTHTQPGIMKEAAQKVVVVEPYGRRLEFPSLVKAVLYLASVGSITTGEVVKMLRGRAGYVNGRLVFYIG